MRKLCLAAITVLALGNASRADLILHVPDIRRPPSNVVINGSFDAFLEETGGTQALVSTYNIPLRRNAGGTLTITGAGASSAAHPSLFNGQAPLDLTNNPPGYVAGSDIYLIDDFGDNNGFAQNAAVQNGVRDGLFSVSYSIPANTAPGTSFTLNVDTNPSLFGFFDAAANDVPVVIDNGSVTLSGVGDTDSDGDVDLADLGNLATSFGLSNPSIDWINGDFDHDNDVDLNDLGSLATNFGAGRDAAFAQFEALVPEPASGVFVLAGLAVLRSGSRRRAI
jgi:hypothetical protein